MASISVNIGSENTSLGKAPEARNVSVQNPDHTSQGQRQRLAELGRIIRQGQDWPQAAVIRKLNPKIRGWANYYRTWVSQATFSRLDHLIWVKLRRWAYRRHPHTSATWIHNRYWRRRDARDVFATPATPDGQVWLTNHNEIPSLFHAKVAGNRSPYDGDWCMLEPPPGTLPDGENPSSHPAQKTAWALCLLWTVLPTC